MEKRKYTFGDTTAVINSDNLADYYGLNVMINTETGYQFMVFTENDTSPIKLIL